METVKILVACIATAVLYGIAHDQVTARVCLEYFTIGHPPIFQTESPTLLALGWGTLATWWAGLLVGIPISAACRIGAWPKLGARQLIRWLATLQVVTGLASLLAGIWGYYAAKSGEIWIGESLESAIAPEKHVYFLADLWAHRAAYETGFAGGLVLTAWILFTRRRLSQAASEPLLKPSIALPESRR